MEAISTQRDCKNELQDHEGAKITIKLWKLILGLSAYIIIEGFQTNGF